MNKFRGIFEIRQYLKFYRPSPNDVFLSPKPFEIRQIGDISPSLATLYVATDGSWPLGGGRLVADAIERGSEWSDWSQRPASWMRREISWSHVPASVQWRHGANMAQNGHVVVVSLILNKQTTQ